MITPPSPSPRRPRSSFWSARPRSSSTSSPTPATSTSRLIEAEITPRTRAIMPVSLYGQPADMDEINAIAARHGTDGDRGCRAELRRRLSRPARAARSRTIGCTSFFPSKPLGCYGDGGAIFTDDEALAQACREIRVHGQSRRYHPYPHRRRRPDGHAAMRGHPGQAEAVRMGDRAAARRSARATTQLFDEPASSGWCSGRTGPASSPNIPSWSTTATRVQEALKAAGFRPRSIIRPA